ncbi:MAG: OB-fold domain-containing protein [Dehalococcoidia bacterium]|nr:OB-fold domain-containing protein [Dehalococcoidia bacterium]
MIGITSYGGYIPLHRLSRGEFLRAWGGFGMPGERAVANHDEDSVTMAIESAIDCMKGIDPEKVDGLFFATTTSPYKERLCASIMATALNMRRDIRTMDVTGTLRAGTTAIATALDLIKAGSAKNILVAAGETRLGAPGGDFEQIVGDGGAALLLGDKGVIASIEGSYSISDDFSGQWRADGDEFIRSWEDRMVYDEGYSRVLPEAISGLMKKYNLAPGDFAKVVYDAPLDVRRHARVAGQLKFDGAKVQDPMFMTVGITGAALTMMMLVAALEEAKPGDKILFASYGNGADAFYLQVTPEIKKAKERRGIKKHLESKRILDNYEKYLRWRHLVTIEAARRPEQEPTSIAALFRDRKIILGLWGVKCKACGTPQYTQGGSIGSTTPIRVCVNCQAKDQFEDYCFRDKKATIFSFTHDNLAASVDPPSTVIVVDFDGGGRGVFDMTDRDPDEVKVGMPVEMTFRKLYHDPARGIHNYFWKTRPIRC